MRTWEMGQAVAASPHPRGRGEGCAAGSLSLQRGMRDGWVFTSARTIIVFTVDYTVALIILQLDCSIVVLLYYHSFVV